MSRKLALLVLLLALFATAVLSVDKSTHSKQQDGVLEPLLKQANDVHKANKAAASTSATTATTTEKKSTASHAPQPKESAAKAEAEAKKKEDAAKTNTKTTASTTNKAKSQTTKKHNGAIKNTRKTLKIRDDLPDYAKAAKMKINDFISSGKSWPGQPDVMGCTPLECQEWCDECDGSITCQSKCFNNLYCRDECAVLLS